MHASNPSYAAMECKGVLTQNQNRPILKLESIAYALVLTSMGEQTMNSQSLDYQSHAGSCSFFDLAFLETRCTRCGCKAKKSLSWLMVSDRYVCDCGAVNKLGNNFKSELADFKKYLKAMNL